MAAANLPARLGAMATTTRIRTTHVGSLPRPEHILELLYRREEGEDVPELDAAVRAAVAEVVARQVEVGIDIVGDGELGKVSYATYVARRMSGFEVDETERTASPRLPRRRGSPRLRRAAAQRIRRGSRRSASPCAPGRWPTPASPSWRLSSTTSGRRWTPPGRPTPSSPRRRRASSPPSSATATTPPRQLPPALAEVMRVEYEAIVRAGFTLQLDCPDLACADDGLRRRRGASTARPPRRGDPRRRHCEHPARVDAHARLLGQLRGAAPPRRAAGDILDIVLRARPAGARRSRRPTRVTTTSGRCSRTRELPDGKVLIPGVIDSTTNYVEHPELVAQRLGRYADASARRT